MNKDLDINKMSSMDILNEIIRLSSNGLPIDNELLERLKKDISAIDVIKKHSRLDYCDYSVYFRVNIKKRNYLDKTTTDFDKVKHLIEN